MNVGKSHTIKDFVVWSSRDLYYCFFIALIPTLLFCAGFTFFAIPWMPVALLGTAVAFIVGFKNNASYNRLWEARQIYGSIINDSRSFAVKVLDFYGGKESEEVKLLFNRHYAWLTFLRYQLREARAWEGFAEIKYVEYMSKVYEIPETKVVIESTIGNYLSERELSYINTKKNRASQTVALQSETINKLHKEGTLSDFQQMQLQRSVEGFYDQQGKCGRIKNFPYPRNFASITSYLLHLFVILLPFGLVKEFNHLGDGTFLENWTIFFVVPFATIVAWAFVTLDAVGDSSINPFEGSANDVPITQISRMIEIDMRDMLDETELPTPVQPMNNIVM
jgi:putative membrane protein